MDRPKRARSRKRRLQPRPNLKTVEPVLYSTNCPLLCFCRLRKVEVSAKVKTVYAG